MLVVMKMNVLKVAQTVNLTVVTAIAFMVHGHVMEWLTVQMAQMKLTVAVTAVQMVNLTVVTAIAFMVHGHVTDMVTVQTVLMKLIVAMMAHQLSGHVQMVIILIHGVTVDVVHTIQYVMTQMQVNGLTVALEKNV